MIGQSAATAAALAIDDRVRVQAVSYAKPGACVAADRQLPAGAAPTPAPNQAPRPKHKQRRI